MTVASCVDEKPHTKKASVDDVFEQRWRKAYEVRALERESRTGAGKSQDLSGSCGADSPDSAGTNHGAVDARATAGQELPPVTSPAAQPDPALATSNGSAESALVGAQEAGGLGRQQQPLRQQEVVDDEEEDEAEGDWAPGSTAAVHSATLRAGPAAAAQQQQQQEGPEEQEEEEEEGEGLAWSVVWDSSSSRPGVGTQPLAAGAAAAAGGERATKLKEQGTTCLEAGDFRGAIQHYSEALAACKQHLEQQKHTKQQQAAAQAAAEATDGPLPSNAADHLLAMLHSNRAHALLKLKYNEQAAADAQQAHTLHPTWPKPLYRLVQARLAQGRWTAAVAACRQGEALCPKDSEGRSDFSPLLDRIAVQAAKAGSLAGYDGIQLEVRDAGEEAWLCRAAPRVPELDGPEDEDTVGVVTHLPLALPGTAGGTTGSTVGSAIGSSSSSQGSKSALALAGASAGGGGAAAADPLVVWDFQGQRGRRRTSFRSVKEAVEAAQEGDRILLRRGTHNGMGECITVAKRLLIEGEGQLGEVVFDQRANCPSFRIARGGVVLRSISVDQSGFWEAFLVDGPPGANTRPLVQDCRFKCSGDDAACAAGAAAPTFVRCIFEAKKVGLKAYGTSAPRFERCSFEKCGEQGVRAMEAAAPTLLGCQISDCGEEAVLGMDTARVTINNCVLRSCKGPGVDLSGGAAASIHGSKIEECVGGVWLWDAASAAINGATLGGGPSHAILADGAVTLQVRDTTVRGSVHASDAAWQGLLHSSNRLMDPEQPTDFPPEEGPFRFVPDAFKRKQ